MPNDSSTLWSIHAATPDGKLAAIVEVGAEDTEIVISLAPTATATGILIDEQAHPVVNTPLYWGRRVFLDEERRISRTCFAPKVVTDSAGRFTLPSLVVGQEYEISHSKRKHFSRGRRGSPRKGGTDRARNSSGRSLPSKIARNAEEMSSFTKTAPGPGTIAPPIEATTLDGKPLKLDGLQGQVRPARLLGDVVRTLHRRNSPASGCPRRIRARTRSSRS